MQIFNTVFYIPYCADFNAKWELQQNFKMRLYCHDFGLLIRRDLFYHLRHLVSKPQKQAANCSMRIKRAGSRSSNNYQFSLLYYYTDRQRDNNC